MIRFALNLIAALQVKSAQPSTPVTSLSGGNQQKLVIGKWLAAKPRFLLLDEPTRGVDVGAKSEIYARIRDLAASGMGVALWLALVLLAPVVAQANVKGALAFVGLCVLGGGVYAALGALLGIVRLSEMRFVMRRQPGLRSTDPDEQP